MKLTEMIDVLKETGDTIEKERRDFYKTHISNRKRNEIPAEILARHDAMCDAQLGISKILSTLENLV